MKLIIGLGNPGKKYQFTRHNAGFLAVEHYAIKKHLDKWSKRDKFKSLIIESGKAEDRVILAMPQTYMNRSGESVQSLKQFYKVANSQIIVVHDEVDIPFGEVRVKDGGGTAGHNGLESIVSHIGSDFKRLRIGTKNSLVETTDTRDFVLSNFSKTELSQLESILSEVSVQLAGL